MRTHLKAIFGAFAIAFLSSCATSPPLDRAQPDPASKGRALLRLQDFAAAIRFLQSAINREPSRPELYPLLAEAKYETGQADEAIQLCRKALELKPDLWNAQELLWKLRIFKADWSDDEMVRVKKEIDEVLARVENGWGCAWADFDRDGFVDLVVASGGGIRLFRNTGSSNHWLHIKLIGKDCNRAAIGARVTVFGANGKRESGVKPTHFTQFSRGKCVVRRFDPGHRRTGSAARRRGQRGAL